MNKKCVEGLASRLNIIKFHVYALPWRFSIMFIAEKFVKWQVRILEFFSQASPSFFAIKSILNVDSRNYY